jgi:hypothetical protein
MTLAASQETMKIFQMLNNITRDQDIKRLIKIKLLRVCTNDIVTNFV